MEYLPLAPRPAQSASDIALPAAGRGAIVAAVAISAAE
jgi:hypothetical protein